MAKRDDSPGPSSAARFFKTLSLPTPPPPHSFTMAQLIAEARKDAYLAGKSHEALKQHIGKQLRERIEAGELQAQKVGRNYCYWTVDDDKPQARAAAKAKAK